MHKFHNTYYLYFKNNNKYSLKSLACVRHRSTSLYIFISTSKQSYTRDTILQMRKLMLKEIKQVYQENNVSTFWLYLLKDQQVSEVILGCLAWICDWRGMPTQKLQALDEHLDLKVCLCILSAWFGLFYVRESFKTSNERY